MPVYRHGQDVYDIPDEEIEGFEAQFPEATVEMHDGEDIYDIPVSEKEGFLSQYPTATYSQSKPLKTAQPVVDAYGMPMQPEVSTIEDAPKVEEKPQENLKSDLFKPQSTETPSLLEMGAKPKDYLAEAGAKAMDDIRQERQAREYQEIMKPYTSSFGRKKEHEYINTSEGYVAATKIFGGEEANRRRDELNEQARPWMEAQKSWTPSSARRFREQTMEQTWYDPYAVVPEEYKALATQQWGKEGSEDAYFSAWMNLSPEEREAFVKREHIKSFFNEETANRMQGIRERATTYAQNALSEPVVSVDPRHSASAMAARTVSNIGVQTTKALDKAEEIKQAYKNHQLDENFFAGAYKGMKDGLTDIDNWTGLYMVGEMTNLYDIADKMEKGEALSQTEEDFLDAQAYKLAVEAALADDLGWGYGSGNVTGASVPFMLQMLASPLSGASGKAIDKGFAAVGRRAIDKFGKGILKKLLTKAPVKKVAKGLVGTVGKGIGQTILFGSDRVAAGTMERHLGNEMVAERANEEFNAGVQAKAGEDLGTALFKAGVSTSMENISEFAGGAFIDDFTKVVGKKISKEFMDAMGGSVGRRMANAAARQNANKVFRAIANNKWGQHAVKLSKSVQSGMEWDGLLNEFLEEELNKASNLMIGDMSMEDFTSLEKNAETLLGLAWTSGFFMANNAASRVGGYVRGNIALKRTDRAARQIFTGDMQEKWEAYTQALSQADGYEEVEQLYKGLVADISKNQDKELAGAQMSEAAAYMTNYVKMMGMNAATEEADKEEQKTPAQKDIETAQGEGIAAQGTEEEMDVVEEMDESYNQLAGHLEGANVEEWLLQYGETAAKQMEAIRGSELDEQTKAMAEAYLTSAQRYEGLLLANQEEVDAIVDEAAKEFDANVNQELGSVIQVLTTQGKTAYVIQGNPNERENIRLRYEDGTTEPVSHAAIEKVLSQADAQTMRSDMIEGVRKSAVAEVVKRMQGAVPNATQMQMPVGHNVVVDGQAGVVAGVNADGTMQVQMQGGNVVNAAPQQVMDAQAYNTIMERKALARESARVSTPVREEAVAPVAEETAAEAVAEEAIAAEEELTEAQKLLQEYMDESVSLEDRQAIVGNNVAQAKQAAIEAQAEVDSMTESKPKATDYTSIAEFKQAQEQWKTQMQEKQQLLDLARQQEATWSEVQKGMVQPVETATEQASAEVAPVAPQVTEDLRRAAEDYNQKHDTKALAEELGISAKRIQRVIDFANQVGVKMNFANVTRTQGGKGAFTNADNMAKDRTITLSKYQLAKGMAIEWVMGHELTHQIKADGNAANWGAYKQAIINALGQDAFDKRVKEQSKVYREAGAYQDMSANEFVETMQEEVCADAAGDMLLNPDNMNKVMGVPQSLASRIWSSLKNMVTLGLPTKTTQAVAAWQQLAEGKELTGEADGRKKHSIVGTTGARALDKAEGATVRMDNMHVAEEMEAAGKDAETIWLATGWERGADGKWKYEVLEDFAYEEPRAKAERLQDEYQQVQNEKENIYRYLNMLPARGLTEQQKAIKKEQNTRLKKLIRQGEQLQDEIIESNFDTTLGELIGTDNNIIRAYPELASMPVSFVASSRFMDAGLKGAFDGEGIWINPTLENTAPTLLHEVQHAIQRIEGFARGGNTGSVKTKADALREDVRPLHEMMLDTPEWAERQRLQNRWFDETDAAEIAKIEQRVNEINESGVLDAIQSKRKQLQEKYGSDATVGKILGSPYAEDAEIWQQLPEYFNDKYEAYRNLAGEAEARNVSARLNMSEEERRQTRPGKTEDVARDEQTVLYVEVSDKAGAQLEETANATRYSIVVDPQLIAELEASPKRKGYRNVVQREDGLFEAPMGNSLRGNGITVENTPFAMGQWEQSEEHPELVYGDNKITLVKPDGKTVADVNYNPYIHNRLNTLNAQFKQAWERPDLVYIETEVPETDLEGGYMAEHAHLSTGVHQWSNGALMLSRYDKPVRIVPWEEVAGPWIEKYKKSGVHFDIVPPALRPILTEAGVEIKAPHNGMGENCIKAYEEWKAEQEVRYSVTPEERMEMEARILDWLSEENLTKAAGMTREQIFEEFGNQLEPIAYLPMASVRYVGDNLTDERIYSGKGYFIDHAMRNHAKEGKQTAVEDIDVSKYLNIQNVLDNPDSIKETFVDGKRTVIFIKKIGRYFAELTQVEENGKIVLHKSFFNQKKEPYAKLADIRSISPSLGGGVSPISHADDAAPAISLQSRNDDELSASKDTQSVSTEQTDKKEISEKNAESNVEVTNEEVMHSISPIEGYTYSEVIDMVQNDVENILSEEGADNVEAVEFWAHGSRMRGNAREDSDLDVVMFYKGNEKEDSLFNLINEHELAIDGIKVDVNPIRISNEQDIARYKEKSARYDQEKRFSLAGLHNISEEKLKKAIKQGGLANPSVAVIDLDTRDHNTYGDITLVLPSYMIDKKQGRNAGTYMGDAWTPTYPRVSMRLDNKGWRKIDEFIASISNDAHMRSNMHYAVEDFMQGGTTPYMQYAFLRTKGIEIPFVYKNNDRYISNEEFKELIGMDALTAFNGSIDAYNKFKELPKEVQDDLYIWIINRGDKAKIKAMKESIQKDQRYAKLLDYEVPFSKFNMFANDTFRREQDNGKIDYAKTFSEANNHVATNGLGAEYNAWISNLLEEAGAEEYIFAGFTPSGNAKYLPHTLENVSKVMKKDGKSNAYNDTGYGPTRAGIIKALSTLGQIRKNSDTLRTDINTVDEAKEELTDRLYELRSKLADMRKLSDNPYINGDYAESRLQEALSRKNPVRHLNEEYGYNIEEDGDFAKKLESFIDDVRKAPVRYFETKFERPVMLDEFHAAVIPNDTDTEVVKALEKAGLNVETYERGNDAERKEALLRASDKHVRFSLSAEKQGIIDAAKADGTYMKAPNGKPSNLNEKQWAQVRTKAFKEWFGDWENDPENASKIVDENGEPLVMYHGGTFGIKEYVPNGAMHFGSKVAAMERVLDTEWGKDNYEIQETSPGEYSWEYADPDDADYDRSSGRTFASYEDALKDAVDSIDGVRIGQYYINAKNPLRVEDQDNAWDETISSAKEAGADALVYENQFEDTGNNSYVAFRPTQIKSATDNVGTFDAENADIRYSMSAEEANRRAQSIKALTAIPVIANNKTKEELKEEYQKINPVIKNGNKIEFFVSAFKKIYKDGGVFAQVIPKLREITEQSVLAYSETDNQGGQTRKDGTTHKSHPNVKAFHNYIGKVSINGTEYYVRITVQEELSGRTGTHSFMVTDVDIYNKSTDGLSLPITTRMRGTTSGIVDTKLQDFFDYADTAEDESSQNDANATSGEQKYSLPARPATPKRNEGEGIMEYAQRVANATEAQKAWDVANKTATDIDRQIKNSEEYRDILAQKEPQTIEEAASVALAGTKLLWDDYTDGSKVLKGVKSMMGWKEGERKRFFAMFASKENGGVSVERMGEEVIEICSQYNIPVDETDAMAGTNAVLEVLQSAQSPSDITGYIEHNRIEQVRRMIEEEQELLASERNRAYMEMYGMTYDDFVEIASTIDAEDEQERSDDKNVIAWLYGQSQRQQERITNAQTELEQLKRNGVPKTQYDAAYRALEQMKAKVKRTQEMLDEATKELRTAKGQATRQRKANMRYKAKKGQWKQVFQELRKAINGKNIRSIDKSTLDEIMRAVGNADLSGMAKLFSEAGMVEDIILGVNMRATQDRIDKLLATKTTALNDKGIATGKSVDASVQAILANVRKTLEGILHHDIENQIHDLRSQNWHIRHNAVGNLSQEQQEQVDANKAKIEELKAELSRELATNTANTEQAVNEQIEKLTEQIDKGIRTEEESAELMTTLALKRQMVAIHTSYQDTATVEALLRRKQSELRTNWVALHDGNIPKDKRAEYRQKRKTLQEQIAGLEAQVREGRQATLDAMQSFAKSLEETITTGRTNLKGKVQEQLQRRKEFVAKAIHDVNASGKQMQSVNEADKQENDKLPWYKRMFSPALRTFDYMLQKVATRTYGKDSWLYRQFMLGENGVMAAHDEYLRGMQTAARTLEDKAKEIFGKSYQDVMADSNRKKDIGIEILRDAEDYEPSYIPLKLTKGQATYIYMLWRMRDGFSKLATQGFTEEIMERIEEYVGPDYIEWADWMQMEYLPMMREKYNARYREIYDTNMAAIDNYVPIRIHGQAIRKEVDLTDATASMPGMQKKNGALIQRTVNVNPIDISNNIFELIGQHIDEMEEFYAYAPVRRDLQYILSSPAFRNILNANEPGTFQSLLEAARIATKTNQQPESAALKAFNDIMNKTQKGLVSGNIAYRNMTAIKQVLSAPAFIGYSQSPRYLWILTKNMLGGYLRNLPVTMFALIPGIGHWAQKMTVEETAKGMPYIDLFLGETFRWCMREFPDFRERVTRGSAGDIRLEEKGFSELLDKYTEIGMSANVFIDAVTVSVGLKSIYDYEMKKAEKRIQKMAEEMQMDEQWEEEEMRKASNAAKIQATLFANQTQQSSNPALLSPMQVSKNFMERSLTLYKNSSLGLMRAGIGGMRNLLRFMKGKKARRRMTEEYTRMFMQEGFAEDEAKKRAISYINSEARKGAFVALLEGYVMNVIWNLGSKGLLGFMAGGGDDDDKERTIGEWVWDGIKHVAKNTFGSAMPFVNDALEGRLPVIGLTTSEAEKAWKDIKKQLDENGISLALVLTGMRYAAKFGGVDMQVWANTMDGYYRLFSETGNSDENTLALMLILNSPHSNRIAVARELYKGKSEEEFQRAIELAGRYNQPVWAFGREMTDKVESDMAKWYLSDNATDEEKQRMRYIEEMEERTDNLETVEDALEMFDEVSDTELRKKISSKIDQISKPEDTFAEKVDRKKENALAEDDTDMGGYTYMKMADSQDLLEEKRMRAEIDMLKPIVERQKDLFEEYGSNSAVYARFMAEHGAEIRRYNTLKAYSRAIQARKRKMDEEGSDAQALYEEIKELYNDAQNI